MPAIERAFLLELPMGLTFVNYHGDTISPSHLAAMRAEALEQERQKRAAARVIKCRPTKVGTSPASRLKPCPKRRKCMRWCKPWPVKQAASRSKTLTSWHGFAKRSAQHCAAMRSNALQPARSSSTVQRASHQSGMD